MKFSQLRLSGFKSFVEPTELLIKDGLTGIVGPNGCGKSNLVEALRWVMGETSAKNMRGGAMDDVIFAGTTSRPAKNAAEVTLGLDNKDRTAPPSYNENEELDVTRRIRRDTGSDYRINGKVTRARDVQLLFADMATGANSTAIVSQGRVGSLINAKPKDRRHLLEEAAGISGLHSRRHEAELRLRAAEGNLERVDDVTGQLEVQLGSLKRQARQATRYRNISGHIRTAEALLYLKRQEIAEAALTEAKEKYKEASSAVAELTKHVALAQNASLKAGEALSPLREAEAATTAKLQRLTLEKEQITSEEERIQKTKKQLEDRKNQIQSDMEREKTLEQEAEEALVRLEKEEKEIVALTATTKPEIEKSNALISEKQQLVRETQQALDHKTESLAEERARQNALEQQIRNLEQNQERLQNRKKETDKEILILQNQLANMETTDNASDELKGLIAKLDDLSVQIESAEEKRQEADRIERSLRDKLRQQEKDLTATETEIKTLERMIDQGRDGNWRPVADNLKVKSGYEKALGAALGDDLDAPTDNGAPSFWQIRDDCKISASGSSLPTLDQYVKGSDELHLRLKHILVAGTVEEAANEASNLLPGYRIVTKEGDLWRWDGYSQKASAKTAATIRLEQKNRLQELQAELEEKSRATSAMATELEGAEENLQLLKQQEQEARGARRDLEKQRNQLQSKVAEQQRALNAKTSRLESLQETQKEQEVEITDSAGSLKTAREDRTSLPDLSESQAEIERMKSTLRESRDEIGGMRSRLDSKIREMAIKEDRLKSIASEKESWRRRVASMADHFSQLEIRFSSTEQDLEALENKPQELAQKRGQIMDELARAEGARAQAREHVEEAEAVKNQCESALREAEHALGRCREERVRYEADKEHCESDIQSLAQQIAEKLDCAPKDIRPACQINQEEELPPIDVSERKVERLKKERDGMGPVNLRAEIEAEEVNEQLETLLNERQDLEEAIARLRQGIASLNKEGRERLLVAFKKVDEHFQTLFKEVFGGGYAHLKLTESEDPLAAGLEIMASPPGKRLQLMSLLSGGEQALTAVALLFAVFLTNPAPICVLDEVDAPLDDVNVERLCNLLDTISKDSATRFLVVTHHPITMARMDRLFGVTMAERGISQLVSVDLTRAQLMTNEVA
ncbi:chromosome segregation protein SMC [Sneathiella sp. P13V-1]|uniref:chromosome segregation protein SMC n=1 Tax=Sneathiella sp. P13V-1 TaxID=2697366 RepID=UPI00187B72EC|nr:chromosome segregation protein SMC [Sneathiella sp. P13V-1]MBE7635570.1 chromosome segregation protein SMC [Sneathiella sp. P13V-1]